MFRSDLSRKRVIGLLLLAALLALFLWFNRIPKLDTVQQDLVQATAPLGEAQCFQGLCIDGNPESSLLERWWRFSLTYMRLVALGMTFAFLMAGLTEAFLFPPESRPRWGRRGIKGSLQGLLVGPAMNLCSACIVPVSASFRRRGAGLETTVAIVQGSSTLNLPALIMAALVFAPALAGSRIGISLVGALLLGPLVAWLAQERANPSVDTADDDPAEIAAPSPSLYSWREIAWQGGRDWLRASFGYLLRLGPVMVLAGFASGLALQWVSPDTVQTYLGNDLTGVVIAATLGLLINVPLLFEIPLVAALLLVGMGTAPAATLLFAAAAGGPVTFWGLARYLPRRAVLSYAAATWALGLVAGVAALVLGLWFGLGRPGTIELTADGACPGCELPAAVERLDFGGTLRLGPGVYTLTEELILNKDLHLAGAGAATTIIQAATEPGGAQRRVASVPFGRRVEISGVTLRNGLVNSTEPRHLYFPATNSGSVSISLEFGGGLHLHGDLTLREAIIEGNQAGGGAGIYNGGNLIMENVILRGNRADGIGGALFNGGIVTLRDSRIEDNHAFAGGGAYNLGQLDVWSSRFSGNEAELGGGGILNSSLGVAALDAAALTGNRALSGGGVRNEGRMTLTASDISGNTGRRGGGVLNMNRLRLQDTAVTGNRGEYGGGIATFPTSVAPITELAGATIADNQGGNGDGEGIDCLGELHPHGQYTIGNPAGCRILN